MSTRKARIILPADLVKEIDEIAGSRGRSGFLIDLAQREIKRSRLLRIFGRDEPIWRDEDHPELRAGAAEWVRQMRRETESHFESSDQRRKRESTP